MKTKSFKYTLLLALPVIAVLSIPGEAASVSTQDGAAVAADTRALPQAEFGMLLDPYVEPVLHFEPPTALWDL